MIVQALQRHRALGEPRAVGSVFHCAPDTGRHLLQCGLARLVADNEDWSTPYGRELRTEPLTDKRWPRVVACLNIWNDRAALERTLPTWINRVDALVVADGKYDEKYDDKYDGGGSTDGLFEFLREAWPAEKRLLMVGRSLWEARAKQSPKRTAIMQEAAEEFPDALLLVVDADEFVSGTLDLHDAPEGDVLWVTVSSPLYTRPYGQPRLIRAQPGLAYRGRHHWLYAGDRLLATHQYGGVGVEHRLAHLTIRNERGLGRDEARRQARQTHRATQIVEETVAATPQGAKSDKAIASREALRIAAVTTYDPGLVAFRLHTAINTTTPHASVFFRTGDDNPYRAPRQYDARQAPEVAAKLLAEADVVHCHLDYTVLDALKVKPKALVIHHHGTALRNQPFVYHQLDAQRADLRLVSNLELLSYGTDLKWLPNPVSVARLQRLRQALYRPSTTLRVAHSPSKRHLKGTDALLSACEALRGRGVAIEAVLIEGMEHGAGLALKAGCDVCFDSFWLGIQCSGVEAGAMGMPVIAGDLQVYDRYMEQMGAVPYIYANNQAELEIALEDLATNEVWREEEARRVHAYVLEYHDDAAVALRYLDLLDEAIGWRAALTLGPKVTRKRKRKAA